MTNLRTAVSIGDSKAVESQVDSEIRSRYGNLGNISTTSMLEFFYPHIVKVFYVERGHMDPESLDYLTLLLGDKMISMSSIPHKRTTFTRYVSDQNLGLDPQNNLTSEQFGDLSLFNSGILFPYLKTRTTTLGQDYFRNVGIHAYNAASSMTRNADRKNLFTSLSCDFLFFEDGLRDIASRFIWGGPGKYLVEELTRIGSKIASDPSNEDILLHARVYENYQHGIKNSEKYSQMKSLFKAEKYDSINYKKIN